MAINVTMLNTSNGLPVPAQSAPVINIWNISGSQVITNASMSQVGTTSFYNYSFSTAVYGTTYVYQITSDSYLTPAERYRYGTIYQEVPDRIFGTVVANGGNTATTFSTNLPSSVTNYYDNALLLFVTSTGSVNLSAPTKITGYNPTNSFVTLATALPSSPTAGDQFVLIVI